MEDDLRYHTWYGVQYMRDWEVIAGWRLTFTSVNADDARRCYHDSIQQAPNVHWRLCKIGPPEYNFIIREVLQYAEARP